MELKMATASKAAGILTIRDFERFLHAAGFSKTASRALASQGWAGLAGSEEAAEVADILAILKAADMPPPARWSS